MPQGFFTIEQWKPARRGGKSQWIAIQHLDGYRSLADVIETLKKPGFYRIVQTQRMIWAEKVGGKLKLRRWHAMSPQTLSNTAAAFEHDKGRWPVEKIRPSGEKQRIKKDERAGVRPDK